MRNKMRGYIDWEQVTGVACLAAFPALIAGAMWFDSYRCHSKASLMGLESQWGPVIGCMVKVEENRWAPINYIRIVDGKVMIQGNEED